MTFGYLLPEIEVRRGADKRKRKKAASGGKKVIPDEVILQMRWRHEVDGWEMRKVSREFGINYGRIYDILIYRVRSKLLLPLSVILGNLR